MHTHLGRKRQLLHARLKLTCMSSDFIEQNYMIYRSKISLSGSFVMWNDYGGGVFALLQFRKPCNYDSVKLHVFESSIAIKKPGCAY